MQELVNYLTVTPIASIIFVITLITSIRAFNDPILKSKCLLVPYDMIRYKKYEQLILSGLVHADWIHLIFNMVAYYYFAFLLEGMIGHIQFAILYFGSMVLADVSTVLKHQDNPAYASLGASGAVSGVVAATSLFFPHGEILLFLVIPIPALLFPLIYILGSHYLAKQGAGNINHDAHMWGAIAGIGLAFLMKGSVIIEILTNYFNSLL